MAFLILFSYTCSPLLILQDALWNEGKIAMHLTFLVGMTTGSHYTDYQKVSRHVPKEAWARVNTPSTPSKQTEHKFYMGCLYSPIKPSVRRRVDIKLYPYRERAFATLYFTGNGKCKIVPLSSLEKLGKCFSLALLNFC